MYSISKTFGPICAAHHLPLMEDGHPCKRPHGHNYIITLELETDTLGPDDRGMVFDYGRLDPFKAWLMDEMDHQDLNESAIGHACGYQTTAENIAELLFHVAESSLGELPAGVRISKVIVKETENTEASFCLS